MASSPLVRNGKKIRFFTTGPLICAACLMLLILPHKATASRRGDSIMSMLKAHPQNDTVRVNLLAALSGSCLGSNVDSAISLAAEGLSTAQKINFQKGAALSMEALGLGYLNKNEYNRALENYNNALQLIQQMDNKAEVARLYCYIGNVYTHETKHGVAIDYYNKSLTLSRMTNDAGAEGLCLESMGSLYDDLGNMTESLKYYLDALRIFEKIQDTDQLSSCLSNITGVYSALGNYKLALDYNKKSEQIFLKTGNGIGLLSTVFNAALTYGRMNEYRQSIALFEKVIAVADSLGDKYWKGNSLADIGEAYYKLGSYDTAYAKYVAALYEAEATHDNANIALEQNGIGSVLVKKGAIQEGIKHLLIAYNITQKAGMKAAVQEVAMNLSSAYEQVHDFPSALKYYKEYAAYTDSLFSEQNNRQVQQLQFDYDLGKKESQISLLQKDNIIAANKSEKQSAIILTAFAFLFLLTIASILLYRSRAYEKHGKEEILKQKEEIQLQAAALTELNRFKDKTFSVLSHDLKGPISAFSSIITMLDENTISVEEYQELKPQMNAQIASLTILLDNLLKWSSGYMKGQIAAIPVNTNLHNIARQNINLLQSEASKKNLTINNEIPPLLTAYCDMGQIDIVIRNLTINAIKFTGHNGTITLSAKSEYGKVYLSVADNGVGMTKAQVERLFTIADDNHTYGTDGETGTGLGLLLCYEFVKANNGSISVSSEEGRGSTFTIELKAIG